MRLTKRQLQSQLDALAKANCRAVEARNRIYEHCQEVYGATPSDVDNDEFIDRVDGGCGSPDGMSADEFHRSMRKCLAQKGTSDGN